MIDLKNLTIKKVHEAIKGGEYTSVDLLKSYLEVIKEKNKDLNAYLEVFESAENDALKADQMFREGKATLMTGIPIALKDNILVKDHKSSAGSKILENYVATYDSEATKRLKEAGAVIIGRTNMDEFAMGSSTENSAYGVVKNPLDISRVSGGSSGGSAVAVAGDMALVSLGSDTGGSVRNPASFCGIVGLKPTYGAISRSGLISLGSSLDIIGQFGKSVSDVEIVFNTLKGQDELDATSLKKDLYTQNPLKKVIGILKTGGGLGESTLKNLDNAKERFLSLGYEIKEIEIPFIKYSLAVYYIIMPAEASANLARYDGVKYGLHKDGENLIDDYFESRGEGLGRETRRRILLGTYVLSSGYQDEYYYKALSLREKIKEEFNEAFNEVDFILSPTTPDVAFKIGEKADPVSMYLEDIFTVPANITGIPAISLPYGSDDGLPLGIQLMAPHQREDSLFKVSKEFLGED